MDRKKKSWPIPIAYCPPAARRLRGGLAGVAGACAFGVARGGVRGGVASGSGRAGEVARHAGGRGDKPADAVSMDARARGGSPRLSEGQAYSHFRAVVLARSVSLLLPNSTARSAVLIETAFTPRSRRCSVTGYQQCHVRLWPYPFRVYDYSRFYVLASVGFFRKNGPRRHRLAAYTRVR